MAEVELQREIERLIALSDCVDFSPAGSGTGEAWIRRAEEQLGFDLPSSYRWWLSRFGGGEIAGQEIYSVYAADQVLGGGDIAYMHVVNQRTGHATANQLFICQPGTDEEFYFRLDERTKDCEYPVYVVDLANRSEMKYADDFLGFLKNRIEALS